MLKFYVYAHRHPITKEPFYIGEGTKNRAFERVGRSERWRHIVSELRKEGLIYSVEILHILETKAEAVKLEKIEISKYVNLVNIRDKDTSENMEVLSFGEDMKYIGDKITDARIYKNIRADSLAKELKISRTTLQKIESGKGLKSEIGIVLRILARLDIHCRLPL